VIAEAPFFFSAAAIGMSLASLAGLVVAFRRGDAWLTHDLYRLRQIVEFGFAAALLALFVIPLAGSIGAGAAGRIAALTAFACHRLLSGPDASQARRRRADLVIAGDLTAYQWTLLALLARPMVAFLLFPSTLQPK